MPKVRETLIFKIEHQFTLYLQRVGFQRERLNPVQLQELRRAFYGGIAQMFILCTQDISPLNLEEKNEFVQYTTEQLTEFWNAEGEKHRADR